MSKSQFKALKRLSLRVQRETSKVTRTYVVMQDGTVQFINK